MREGARKSCSTGISPEVQAAEAQMAFKRRGTALALRTEEATCRAIRFGAIGVCKSSGWALRKRGSCVLQVKVERLSRCPGSPPRQPRAHRGVSGSTNG